STSGGSESELTAVAATPREHRTGAPHGHGVVCAGVYVGDRPGRDGDRSETRGRGSVAELAELVVTPGDDRVGRGAGDEVVPAGGDLDDAAHARHQDRAVAPRGRAVADLTEGVASPGEDPAVGSDGVPGV